MLSLRLLSLVALAVASPIGSVQDYARALKHVARQSVGEQDVDNFAFYAQHSGAAYCNSDAAAGSPITCGGNCPTIEGNGATILGTFDGFWTGIAGYVSVDDARGEIVFSVRGSSNILNWISNLNFNLVDSPLTSGAKVHDGFQSAWSEMSEGVTAAINDALASHAGYRIVATGHSLGGAVATLGAAQLRNDGHQVDIYTFGAPRVGNDVVSDYISAQAGPEFRITHLDDPVSRLPPITFGYRHTSPEYWLSGSESAGEDYPLEEIQVCVGNDNVDCNAGTSGLNIGAHSTYFGPVSECTRAATTADISAQDDEELESRLNTWVQEDIDFVKGG